MTRTEKLNALVVKILEGAAHTAGNEWCNGSGYVCDYAEEIEASSADVKMACVLAERELRVFVALAKANGVQFARGGRRRAPVGI